MTTSFRSLSRLLSPLLLLPTVACDLTLVDSTLTATEFGGQGYVLESTFAPTDFRDDGEIDWYAIYDAANNEVQCRCAITNDLHGTYSLTDWAFTGMTLADTTFAEVVWVGQEDDTAANRPPRVVKLDWTCNMIGYGPIATPNLGGHSTHILDLTSDAAGNPWILVRRAWPNYPSYDVNAIYTALPDSGGYHYVWAEQELDGDIPPEHYDTQESMRIAHDDYDDSIVVLVDDDAPGTGWLGVYARGGWHNTTQGNELTLVDERALNTDGLGPTHDLAIWAGSVFTAMDVVVAFEGDEPSDVFDMSASSVAVVPHDDSGSWLAPALFVEGVVFGDSDGNRIHQFDVL